MIASATRRTALGGALLVLGACSTPVPAPPPAVPELLPLAVHGVPVPDAIDHAAHDLAAAALLPDSDVLDARLERLELLERERTGRGGLPSGVPAFAAHLRDATLHGRHAYREATRALLDRDGLDPALRAALEEELADDPVLLAEKRLDDARRSRLTGLFNTLAAPIGRSLTSLPLAPYRLSRALLALVVLERREEPISVAERQALAHWKAFLDAHPEEATPDVLERVHALQVRWMAMKRARSLDAAEQALEHGRPTLAFVLAERALRYAPEDEDAARIRTGARAEVLRALRERRRTLEVSPEPPPDIVDPGARALALALVLPEANLENAADVYLARAPDGALAEVARFARASGSSERGDTTAAWRTLEELAERGSETPPSFMARHAEALLDSPSRHPYRAFRAARRGDRIARSGWILLGPRAAGPRELGLPDPLEWMIEAPTFLEALAGMPNRLIRLPWLPPTATPAAVHARHYLALRPEGAHAVEVRAWLVDFESDRGNAIEAHRLATEDPSTSPERLAELTERAAEQGLETARHQTRPDLRLGLLQHTARSYSDTESGREAGRLAREEARAATPQQIRISRGFLEEHREVAGREALGLKADLFDGENDNGELHPEGVRLLGAHTLELALIDARADEEDPPRRVRTHISGERLARIVARLDEAAIRTARIDSDAPLEPDADRDLFFERARLGAADRPDPRPTARSTYTYLGVQERYGMVRRRESILPVELVLQGSFDDLGLGAFPRLRPPKPTPDVILYE